MHACMNEWTDIGDHTRAVFISTNSFTLGSKIYLRSPAGDPALVFASFKDSRPGKEDQGVFHQS
jgi:hypothetical protein